MPRGPKGQKRPADVIGNAVLVMKIATGEAAEATPAKDPAAVALGRKGGRARAAKLTPTEKSKIAQDAAAARWKRTR